MAGEEVSKMGWGLPVAAGVSAIGSALKKTPERYPINWAGKRWATRMGKRYPEIKPMELPGIAPEAADLISRLMSGELPTGVSRALGGGAERAYGAQLSGLSDIGAGPATLAGMRGDIMGRLGEQKAMLGWQGMQTGLAAVPGISGIFTGAQKWDAEQLRKRWTDIANLFMQVPGAAAMKPEQSMGFVPTGY